jgi:tetratricopeptide (TPR) repeat protein
MNSMTQIVAHFFLFALAYGTQLFSPVVNTKLTGVGFFKLGTSIVLTSLIFTFGIDYFNIGLGLYELGRYEEAKDAYLRSRAAFKAKDEIDSLVECDYWLTEVYVELKDPVNIIHHGQRALDFYTLLGDDRRVWTLKYFLGIAHRLLDDLVTAARLYDEARSLAITMGWKEWEFLIKVDLAVAELYEINGVHESAAEIHRRVKSIQELAAKDVRDEAA